MLVSFSTIIFLQKSSFLCHCSIILCRFLCLFVCWTSFNACTRACKYLIIVATNKCKTAIKNITRFFSHFCLCKRKEKKLKHETRTKTTEMCIYEQNDDFHKYSPTNMCWVWFGRLFYTYHHFAIIFLLDRHATLYVYRECVWGKFFSVALVRMLKAHVVPRHSHNFMNNCSTAKTYRPTGGEETLKKQPRAHIVQQCKNAVLAIVTLKLWLINKVPIFIFWRSLSCFYYTDISTTARVTDWLFSCLHVAPATFLPFLGRRHSSRSLLPSLRLDPLLARWAIIESSCQ